MQRGLAWLPPCVGDCRWPGAADRDLALCGDQSAYAISAYILVCAVLTISAAALMADYTGKDIEGE
jgi:hypothetical protein